MFVQNERKTGQTSSKSKFKILPLVPNWAKENFGHLGIGQKIGFGYGLAISIAILGSISGFAVGEWQREDAAQQQKIAHHQQLLLHNLQSAGLEARSHALRLPAVLGSTAGLKYEYQSFIEQTNRTKKLLSQLKSFIEANQDYLGKEAEKLENLSDRYAIIIEYYALITQSRLEEINAWNLKPEETEAAKLQLLTLSSGENLIVLDELTKNLNQQIIKALEREEKADETLENTDNLRLEIILTSILISAAIAVALAIYTSRAIARPIREVAEVANQVAIEHNFNLRASINSQDEVGLLAASLNHLIEQVAEYTENLKETQNQLIQTEKMSSIGQMVAGVAHEINNPINFIHGNIEYANNYVQELLKLISLYQQEYPSPSLPIKNHIEEIDLEFLAEDLPKTLSSLQMGSDKIREIVISMRNFSRLDECNIKAVDLAQGIDSTLIILNHKLKTGIKLIKKYGNIPLIYCYPSQLNQVFMNIISNAIDALEETQNAGRWRSEESPTIWINTEFQKLDASSSQEYVKVIIKDNGPGISPEIQEKMFDAFFTTKSVGKGTGLGLAISYKIVAKHHGTIKVNSEPATGTEFVISLPVQFESVEGVEVTS